MALGVLNNLSAVYAEHNLNNTNSSLQTVLEQLSSGSRINSGADDAAGLSLVNGLAANSAALVQSGTNATEGVGLLQVADGALSQVTTLLNRAITLATEASNGTLNSTQESAANQEYQSILAEISNIGSTTTYNQEMVFSGNTVSIYTGDSSLSGASVDQLSIRTLSSSSIGDTDGAMTYSNGDSNVFIDLSSNGKNASLTDSLNSSGTTTITVQYMSAGSSTPSSTPITVGTGTNYANTVQGLIQAINSAGLGLTATFGTAASAGSGAVDAINSSAATDASNSQASASDTGIIISGSNIGVNNSTSNGTGEIGTLTVTDSASAANAEADALSGTMIVTGSNGVAHTVTLGTPGMTDNLSDLSAWINQQGWGVSTVLTTNTASKTASLAFISGSAEASIAETGDSVGGTGTGVVLSGVPATSSSETENVIGTITGTPAGSTSDYITVGTEKIYETAADTSLAALESTINSGDYGVTAVLQGSTLVLYSANSVAPSAFSTNDGTLTATVSTGSTSPYYSVGISTSGITDSSTGGGTSLIGISSDPKATNGTATISYSDDAGADLAGTSLTDQTSAQAALKVLNEAITDVAAMDGYIGAQINTLNAISQVMSTQQENILSAQNAIQATDYASATSNMSKYEVLSQTGIAALAQANSVQQEVTKLLQ